MPGVATDAKSGRGRGGATRTDDIAAIKAQNAAASADGAAPAAPAAEGAKAAEELTVDRLVAGLKSNGKVDAPKRLAALQEIGTMSTDGAAFLRHEAYLINSALTEIIALNDDKDKGVRTEAEKVIKAFFTVVSSSATRLVLRVLFSWMTEEAKWRPKAVALEQIKVLSEDAPREVSSCLPEILPVVTHLVHDTREEVASAARAAITAACGVIDNRDIVPFVPALIESLIDPAQVPETIQKLASTTFVQTVDSAALAIVVPLMIRGFRERAAAIKRMCCRVVANMSKLVENPREALVFMDDLIPALARAAEEIADPEARSVAQESHKHMIKLQTLALASNISGEQPQCFETIKAKLAAGGVEVSNFGLAIEHASFVCAQLIRVRSFEEKSWSSSLEAFLAPIAPQALAASITADMLEIGKKSYAAIAEDDTDKAEILCDCKFTLAYGTKILLHNTDMKLLRGARYGLLGQNDSGKTTLLRSIANGSIDGFPDPTTVRTVFVEADIQGEISHLPCLEYVLAHESIQKCGATREEVGLILQSVGFTPKMVNDPITTLSGGWRMKLALARAMLQKADILLLDEPTNHLDVRNVAWVQQYLNSLKDVTSIIVSHDSGLLDKCCTHIIQIESLKLKIHKGNLSAFVEKVPEALSYFKLSATKFKFRFPQPGYLEGVKSKGKPLIKMDGVSLTYPINQKPTISDVTVRVSLSSRVACVGPNGAGKSTMIKCLTGELEPTSGTVWKFPNAKIGYIAQHAFHHIEKHLDKTPNEYIRWRFDNGEDKEGLDKVTMKITDEELALFKSPIQVKITDADGNSKQLKRTIEQFTGGRRNGKRGFEYEIKWVGLPYSDNTYYAGEKLEELGFAKFLKVIDAKIAAREGMYARPLTQENVEKHLTDVGLEPEFATHYRIRALSGGQKVKVVLAAAMWDCPHILILDEPTNYLDRDSLGALAAAIEGFDGGIVMITHNNEFCSKLCPETWVVENGKLDCRGDPEWMKNALEAQTEFKMIEEMVDATGNTVKVKQPKKVLTRKEKMQRQKARQAALERGEQLSSDSEEDA